MLLRFYLPSTESRTRGYVNNARNLPTSRTQRTQGRNIPVQGNPSLRYTFFLHCCAKHIFIVRFLRIHPVQNIINSPTQLSGRGFPYTFYMKLVVSQLYVFCVLKIGSRAVWFVISFCVLGVGWGHFLLKSHFEIMMCWNVV